MKSGDGRRGMSNARLCEDTRMWRTDSVRAIATPISEHGRHFHVEHEDRVGRDIVAGAARPVAKVRRHHEPSLASDAHAEKPFFPRGDRFVAAERHADLA